MTNFCEFGCGDGTVLRGYVEQMLSPLLVKRQGKGAVARARKDRA